MAVLRGLLVLVAVVGLVWFGSVWGISRLGERASPPASPPATVPSVEVIQRAFGERLPLAVIAQIESTILAAPLPSGIVTSHLGDGVIELAEGSAILSVDGVDVIAAIGAMPSYRTLRRGDSGEDVAQLQALLLDLGMLENAPTGEFDRGTELAVRDFNDSRGAGRSKVIELGSIVFLPELDTPLRVMAPELAGVASGGTIRIELINASEPTLTARVGGSTLVEVGDGVVIRFGDRELKAVVGAVHDRDGESEVTIDADISALCIMIQCSELSTDPAYRSVLAGELIVTPEMSGPAVPVASLRSGLAGGVYVETLGGNQLPVSPLVISDGYALVPSLELKTRVRVGDGTDAAG